MLASELIRVLELIIKQHGDMDVYTEGWTNNIDRVEFNAMDGSIILIQK